MTFKKSWSDFTQLQPCLVWKATPKKMELMYQPHSTESLDLENTDMLINGEPLRCADSFTYVQSTVTNTQFIQSQDWVMCTVCIQSIWCLTKTPVVMPWCETVHKNQGIQHCHTPSLVILNGENDSVLMSPKTTHKDPAVTFASYNAYKMARKGTWCGGA